MRASRDDEASSEPDIVQDRATDFHRNNKTKKKTGDTKKNDRLAQKEQNKTNKEVLFYIVAHLHKIN